jgi:hypothetical protein
MNSNRKAVVRLTVAVSTLVLVGAVYGWWYARVVGYADKAAALTSEMAQVRLDADRAREARTQLASIAGDEATIRGHFVAASDIVGFLETLEKTGSSLGSQVEVVSVGEENGARPTLALSLRISGGFDAVVRTLGAIEYAPYDVELTRMALNAGGGGEAGTQWVAEVQLQVGTQK